MPEAMDMKSRKSFRFFFTLTAPTYKRFAINCDTDLNSNVGGGSVLLR